MKFKKHTRQFIYAFLNEDTDSVKIGISQDVVTRLRQIEYTDKINLKLLGAVLLNSARAYEYAIHQHLQAFRQRGEWFDYSADKVKLIVSSIILDDVDSITSLTVV